MDIGDRQITVACRANLWGGDVLRSYRAWPYAARGVRRSDLPVTFVQDTEYEADPKLSEKNKVLATPETRGLEARDRAPQMTVARALATVDAASCRVGGTNRRDSR